MKYKEIKPCLQLIDYIKCYYTIEEDNFFQQRNLGKIVSSPDGYVDIIFNICGQCFYEIGSGILLKKENAYVIGQFTQAYFLESEQCLKQIGVKMYPHAIKNLFSIATYELNDKITELSDLLSKELKTLSDQVIEAAFIDMNISVKIIEEHFLKKITKHLPHNSNLVMAAFKEIISSNGIVAPSALSDKLCTSYRLLSLRFHELVGIPPMSFASIMKYYFLKKYILSTKNINWNKLITMFNYSDHSHMIKEFKKYSGGNPPQKYIHTPKIFEEILIDGKKFVDYQDLPLV